MKFDESVDKNIFLLFCCQNLNLASAPLLSESSIIYNFMNSRNPRVGYTQKYCSEYGSLRRKINPLQLPHPQTSNPRIFETIDALFRNYTQLSDKFHHNENSQPDQKKLWFNVRVYRKNACHIQQLPHNEPRLSTINDHSTWNSSYSGRISSKPNQQLKVSTILKTQNEQR